MTVWDEYLARYRNLPVWSSEVDDEFEERRTAMEESLVTDFSTHCPPSSQEDITWFTNALAQEQLKFFAAFVLQAPREVPEALYEPMLRAAVHERDPSKNRAFVNPCIETFGRKRVNETLLEWFENGSDPEKAGAVQALYHVGLLSTPASAWRRPGADEMFKVIGDLWMRQRCLLLREFVSNPSVLVRQRIIPHLELLRRLLLVCGDGGLTELYRLNGQVNRAQKHFSGNPTYQELAVWTEDNFRIAHSSRGCRRTLWMALPERATAQGGPAQETLSLDRLCYSQHPVRKSHPRRRTTYGNRHEQHHN